jgi:hypothetical protein
MAFSDGPHSRYELQARRRLEACALKNGLELEWDACLMPL